MNAATGEDSTGQGLAMGGLLHSLFNGRKPGYRFHRQAIHLCLQGTGKGDRIFRKPPGRSIK
jgi:hypothetical protein